MKRTFLSFCAAAVVVSFTACSNSSDTTAAGDTTTATPNSSPSMSNVPTTATSTGNYAAMADSLRINSAAGYYVNPRTGKPYKSLTMDTMTGAITDDAGEPVYRYVDNRNWWVYGDSGMDTDTVATWSQVGEAQMKDNKISYKGDGDTWVDYDARWKSDDEKMSRKWKSKDGEVKIKTEKDGDMKIKVGDEKIKVDEDGVRKKN